MCLLGFDTSLLPCFMATFQFQFKNLGIGYLDIREMLTA